MRARLASLLPEHSYKLEGRRSLFSFRSSSSFRDRKRMNETWADQGKAKKGRSGSGSSSTIHTTALRWCLRGGGVGGPFSDDKKSLAEPLLTPK